MVLGLNQLTGLLHKRASPGEAFHDAACNSSAFSFHPMTSSLLISSVKSNSTGSFRFPPPLKFYLITFVYDNLDELFFFPLVSLRDNYCILLCKYKVDSEMI